MPVLGAALKARYERVFLTPSGTSCLSGSYATFADAVAALPATTELGYDRDEAGRMYQSRMTSVLLKDYPALYWMPVTMPHIRRVFDIGGHVGLMYYAYQRYLDYASDLVWTVCDVPAVVRRGELLAVERGASALRFTTSLDDVAGHEMVLATGSLQYIERSLDALLGSLTTLPMYIVVNETPTHAVRDIITLQNIGVAICPYRIAQRDAIPRAITALGYTLVDRWEDPARRTDIPFVTAPSSIAYSGYYFRLPDALLG